MNVLPITLLHAKLPITKCTQEWCTFNFPQSCLRFTFVGNPTESFHIPAKVVDIPSLFGDIYKILSSAFDIICNFWQTLDNHRNQFAGKIGYLDQFYCTIGWSKSHSIDAINCYLRVLKIISPRSCY